jgi:hypothetical protein
LRANTGDAEPGGRCIDAAFAAAVFLITAGAFLPTLRNGFVNWDDDGTLIYNDQFRGLAWHNLKWMFSTVHMANYQPLAWITFAVDYLLWGLNPAGVHLTNLLFHAGSAALFYLLSRELFQRAIATPIVRENDARVAAAVAALLFSIHPLRVESVAWATERRDVLSGLFYLASILFYLQAHASPGRTRRAPFVAACAMYLLGLLSKGIVLSLPLVFLVLDVSLLRRSPADRKMWLEKIPLVLLSVAAGIVGYYGQSHAGALKKASLAVRAAQTVYSWTFYLSKTLLPVHLSPFYEWPRPFHPLAGSFVVSAAVLVIVFAISIRLRRKWPAILVSTICYTLTAAPALGIVKLGKHLAADRYSYLSCMAWAVLAGGGLLLLLRRHGRAARTGLMVAAGLALACLWQSTWSQCQKWRDSETLWRYALSLDADSPLAHNMLALELRARGKLQEADEHCRRALELHPAYVVWCNR